MRFCVPALRGKKILFATTLISTLQQDAVIVDTNKMNLGTERSNKQEAEAFKLPTPSLFNFGADVIDAWARKTPQKIALISVDQEVTTSTHISFSDLKRESNRFANGLVRLGVKRGDRVVVVVPHMPEWYYAILGMNKLGVIYIPTTVMSTPKDIEYRVNEAGATVVLCAHSCTPIVDQIRGKLSAKHYVIFKGEKKGWITYDDVVKNTSEEFVPVKTRSDEMMVIFFTSGTTGLPKMVRHTHTYPIGHLVTSKFVHHVSDEDVHWTVSDTGWAKSAWGFYGQWMLGCTVIQYCYSKIEVGNIFKLIDKHSVTSFCAPPTLYRMMVRDAGLHVFKSLRSCTSAGEPLNPEVISIWETKTKMKIREFYGQSETTAIVGNTPWTPLKPGSMGPPLPSIDVQLVDEDGNIITKTLTEGIIAVRYKPSSVPGLLVDYWNRPDAMKKAFKGDFYLTHDKAYRDEEGYFWFVGRTDDVFKSSGYRIGPFEIESALIEHEAVQEAAVIGVPDETRGLVPKAYVVLVQGRVPSEKLTKELQNHVIKVTAPYKYPRQIEYVKELPKTVSGKIRRAELRDLERQKAKL